MFANMVAKIAKTLPMGGKVDPEVEFAEETEESNGRVYRNFESEVEVEEVSQFLNAVSDVLDESEASESDEMDAKDVAPAENGPLMDVVPEPELAPEADQTPEFAENMEPEFTDNDPLGLDEEHALSADEFEDQQFEADIMSFLRAEDLDWGSNADEDVAEEEAAPEPEAAPAPLKLQETEMVEMGEFTDPSFFKEAIAEHSMVRITAFDAEEQVLQIEYLPEMDPATGQAKVPAVSVENFDDDTGAFIALDGIVAAEVTGAQNLNPAEVELIAV